MKDWMDHLNYLGKVAAQDVDHLYKKEQTYQGSWKRSGGRSAWFMLRRKIDRMLEMLKKPEDPYGFNLTDLNEALIRDLSDDVTLAVEIVDHLRNVYMSEDIFLKIEEDPSGQDGSVLAEVRDLRRYLLLVEAEMVSRGVVAPPPNPVAKFESEPYKPGTPEDGGHHARHEDDWKRDIKQCTGRS